MNNKLKEYINYYKEKSDNQNPIFELMLFENANKELIYPTGKRSGFPDLGASMVAGFYYELETAIQALNENWADIRETVYDAAFILCKFPGLYMEVSSEGRIYFKWDSLKQGYFEQNEPEIFKHVAY